MNVRLQYEIDFLAGIYHENMLELNHYTASLNLVTRTQDHASTNVAMDRVKAFVFGELANTIFINQVHQEQAELMQMLGCNITTLPEDPVDQIVGMMLYYKFNAIMQGRMIVSSLDIQSVLGDQVWYQHDEEDLAGPFASDGWWNEANIKHNNIVLTEQDSNVVKVVTNGWNEYNLEWPDDTGTSANTVVFANFPRNEN